MLHANASGKYLITHKTALKPVFKSFKHVYAQILQYQTLNILL